MSELHQAEQAHRQQYGSSAGFQHRGGARNPNAGGMGYEQRNWEAHRAAYDKANRVPKDAPRRILFFCSGIAAMGMLFNLTMMHRANSIEPTNQLIAGTSSVPAGLGGGSQPASQPQPSSTVRSMFSAVCGNRPGVADYNLQGRAAGPMEQSTHSAGRACRTKHRPAREDENLFWKITCGANSKAPNRRCDVTNAHVLRDGRLLFELPALGCACGDLLLTREDVQHCWWH